MLDIPNFEYIPCEEVDLKESDVCMQLKINNQCIKLQKRVVRVYVPVDRGHQFWKESHLYSWDRENSDSYAFCVEGFGFRAEEASWLATRIATEIIRTVRNSPRFAYYIPHASVHPSNDCKALELGWKLHGLWDSALEHFNNVYEAKEFWTKASHTINDYAKEYPEFELLLSYYHVLTPHPQIKLAV